MALPPWKKRLAWCLAIPLSLALVGLIGMAIVEPRVDRAIRAEEASLQGMGIRATPLSPQDDAMPAYVAIANDLPRKVVGPKGPEAEVILSRLEKAAKLTTAKGAGPFFRIYSYPETATDKALQRVFIWLIDYHHQLMEAKRFDLVAREGEVKTRVYLQLAMGSEGGPGEGLDAAMQGFTASPFIPTSKEGRAYARGRFEKTGNRWLLTGLSRLVQDSRSWLRVPHPAPGYSIPSTSPSRSPSQPWWSAMLSRNTLFRKMADLAVLRGAKNVATRALADVSTVGDPYSEVMLELERDGSLAAQWARSRQSASVLSLANYAEGIEVRRRSTLIVLDLYDRYADGQSATPTWSKKWCVDPSSGRPIVAKVQAVKSAGIAETRIRFVGGSPWWTRFDRSLSRPVPWTAPAGM